MKSLQPAGCGVVVELALQPLAEGSDDVKMVVYCEMICRAFR